MTSHLEDKQCRYICEIRLFLQTQGKLSVFRYKYAFSLPLETPNSTICHYIRQSLTKRCASAPVCPEVDGHFTRTAFPRKKVTSLLMFLDMNAYNLQFVLYLSVTATTAAATLRLKKKAYVLNWPGGGDVPLPSKQLTLGYGLALVNILE